MSDWPQLEQRLLESARQRARRRRLPRLRLFVPLIASVAVAAIVIVLVIVDDGSRNTPIPADEHSVTATPTASDGIAADTTSPLERYYGVFRRPASRDDVLPGDAKRHRQLSRGCNRSSGASLCVRPDTARLVDREGSLRFYLLQGRKHDDLCVLEYVDNSLGGLACTIANADRLAKPMGSYGPPRKGRPASGYTVFADGVQRAAYTFADGTTAVRKVQHNFAYISSDQAITSLAWIVGGQRHIQTVIDVDPGDRAATAGCPNLEPLPPTPGPAATQTARSTAATLAGVPDGDVTVTRIRPATPADIDDLRLQTCGDSLTKRSLVAELTYTAHPDGQLLIGFRDGTAIVWSQLR